jgi:uncharacterized protein
MNSKERIDLVKTLYESLGTHDVLKLKEIATGDVVWDVAEGFPFGGRYEGLDAVLRDFYGRFLPRLGTFGIEHDRFVDGGDCVVATGYYHMTAEGSSRQERVRFAHVWEIREGKIAGVWEVADTARIPSR